MKNEKFIWLFIIAFIFFFFSKSVLAESSYVLPYPSTMPGGMSYKLHLLFENSSKYWYFGNFGQFSYNLKMADKYLVQAKTLFEYKQYLLGYEALKESDSYFSKAISFLQKAADEKKEISYKRAVLKEAALKHIEVLEKIDAETPDAFVWQPEKELPTSLTIQKAILSSISIREASL